MIEQIKKELYNDHNTKYFLLPSNSNQAKKIIEFLYENGFEWRGEESTPYDVPFKNIQVIFLAYRKYSTGNIEKQFVITFSDNDEDLNFMEYSGYTYKRTYYHQLVRIYKNKQYINNLFEDII